MGRRFAACLASMVLFANAAGAGQSCDVIRDPAPLLGDAVRVHAELDPPVGCAKTWTWAMRVLRTARVEPGVALREEIWGIVVEETAEDCSVDGTAIETGHQDLITIRCEIHYRCVDDEAVAAIEPICANLDPDKRSR